MGRSHDPRAVHGIHGPVGWGLATGDVLALAPGLVGLVCAMPLQWLSYQVHAEDRRTPQQVLWHNPYDNDWKEL